MASAVLDTSVLVRYLTGDDPAKAASTRAYLQAASARSLLVPDVAVAELAFVLIRVYHWPATGVADAIRAVVSHTTNIVPGEELWHDIVDDIAQVRRPVDAYLVRTAERASPR